MKKTSLVLLFCLHACLAGAGTIELVKDLNDREVIAGSAPWYLGTAGGRALFAAERPQEQGQRLYRTDGTAAGTVQFTVAGLIEPRYAAEIAGRVVFFASPNNTRAPAQLWSSDGTDAGTTMIRDLGNLPELGWIASGAQRGYFCAGLSFYTACDLYVTNATAAGTTRLTTDRRVFGPAHLTAAGGLYFFSSASDGTDFGLWFTDGTAAGTRLLYSLPALGIAAVGPLVWADANSLVINADDVGNQRGLYRIDVNTGVTTLLAVNDYTSFAESAVTLNGQRYFVMDRRLWRSDGTPGGTAALNVTNLPHATLAPLAVLGNRLVFASGTDDEGTELWSSDGTAGGTTLLAEAVPGPAGTARLLVATAQRAFFIAGDHEHQRFWVTDGTPAGTRAIPQRGGGVYDLNAGFYAGGVIAGTRIFLVADEWTVGPFNTQFAPRLWVTDLTGTDAVRAGPAGPQLQVLGDRVVFANMNDAAGVEPWVSDGTVAGTQRLRDLAQTGSTGHSDPRHIATVGNRAFFSANDETHGRELWVSDGTAAGTRLVRDINPGTAHAFPENLESVAGALYFIARDTDPYGLGGLWRSDGTEAGTVELVDAPVANGECGDWITAYAGRVWFFGANAAGLPIELWSTDGSAAGTRMEFTLPNDIAYREICDLTATTNGLVFAAQNFGEHTLWRTDGTLAGTERIQAVNPVRTHADADWFTPVDGTVFFAGAEPNVGGTELWRTDGSAAGTVRVADLTPGSEGARVLALTRFGTGIVFTYESAAGTAPSAVDGFYRLAGPAAVPERLKAGDAALKVPVSVGGKVFFVFREAGVTSLWVSDGTGAGTQAVAIPGLAAGTPVVINGFAPGDGRLFFHGPITGTSEELWMTNGNAGGTHRLNAALSGAAFYLHEFAIINNRVFFVHDNGATGNEPWMVVNRPPVAVADSASVLRDANVLIDVRANDSDPDSPAGVLILAATSQPAHGTLVPENGGWRYTPTAGYVGTDSFDYVLFDEFQDSSSVTRVTITVNAPPPPPKKKKKGGSLEWITLAVLLAVLARRQRWLRRCACAA